MDIYKRFGLNDSILEAIKSVTEKKKTLDPADPKQAKGDFEDRKDKDIDNDGDVDKSDKYLHAKRGAISKAIEKGKKKKDQVDTEPTLDDTTGVNEASDINRATRASIAKASQEANRRIAKDLYAAAKKHTGDDAKHIKKAADYHYAGQGSKVGTHMSTWSDKSDAVKKAINDAQTKEYKAHLKRAGVKTEEVELEEASHVVHVDSTDSKGKRETRSGLITATSRDAAVKAALDHYRKQGHKVHGYAYGSGAGGKAGKMQTVKEAPDGVAPQAVDQHNCATHVYHEQWGEGQPVFSMHAEPDENGLIEWYDVMFEHGIEKHVSVSEMKVVKSESHMNHKKKK